MLTLEKLLSGRGRMSRLAEACKLSRSMLSLLKSGRRKPSVKVVERLAKATDTRVVVADGVFLFEKQGQAKTGSDGKDCAQDDGAESLELLSTAQAAELLGVGEERIRRLLRAKKLPGVQLGGRWMVKRSVLTSLLGGAAGKGTA